MFDANEESVIETLACEIRRQVETGAESLDLNAVLRLSLWSRRQTERLFRERFLTSPARYFRDCQSQAAERLLKGGEDVLSASIQSGFASPGRLHEAFVQRRGMTPGEVRRHGAGVYIRYGFFDTPLGIVLLAGTPRGLCALRLCYRGAQEQIDEVHADFPAAEFAEDAEAVQTYADQLVLFLTAQKETFQPTLDILRGTTFQREVWAELQKLPPGETVSYSELAERVGRPGAVRAVAGACARNSLAIAVPCHRAVRRDGSLAGFRWGIAWKQRLLALEAQHTLPSK